MPDILLTGATGFVGRHILSQLLASPAARVATAGRAAPDDRIPHFTLDLARLDAISATLDAAAPDVIVHAAAMADVRTCERDPEKSTQINAGAPARIAEWAAGLGKSLVFISTDQVFDGNASWYGETSPLRPVNVYGQTKAAAEEAVLASSPRATVVRLALVIGRSRGPRPSGSDQVLQALRAGEGPTLFTDEFRTPIHVADAARLIVDLALALERPPVIHLAGPDRLSRYDLGYLLARSAGLDPTPIKAATHAEIRPTPARPADVSLDTSLLRSWTPRPPRPMAQAAQAC